MAEYKKKMDQANRNVDGGTMGRSLAIEKMFSIKQTIGQISKDTNKEATCIKKVIENDKNAVEANKESI